MSTLPTTMTTMTMVDHQSSIILIVSYCYSSSSSFQQSQQHHLQCYYYYCHCYCCYEVAIVTEWVMPKAQAKRHIRLTNWLWRASIARAARHEFAHRSSLQFATHYHRWVLLMFLTTTGCDRMMMHRMQQRVRAALHIVAHSNRSSMSTLSLHNRLVCSMQDLTIFDFKNTTPNNNILRQERDGLSLTNCAKASAAIDRISLFIKI